MRDAPRLVAREEVRRPATVQLPFEIDVGERVPISIADDEASPIQLRVGLVDGPGRREAVLGLVYRQDKNGLTAAWRRRSKEYERGLRNPERDPDRPHEQKLYLQAQRPPRLKRRRHSKRRDCVDDGMLRVFRELFAEFNAQLSHKS